MSKEFKHKGLVGGSVSVALIRESDGFYYDTSTSNYAAQPAAANVCTNLTEVGTTGLFTGDMPAAVGSNALSQQVYLAYYNQTAAAFTYGDDENGIGVLIIDALGAVVSLAQLELIADVLVDTVDIQGTLGAPVGASLSADIDSVSSAVVGVGNAVTSTESKVDTVVAKLPTAAANMAGEGAVAKNLDQVIGSGTATPFLNIRVDESLTVTAGTRADGTSYRKLIRMRPGETAVVQWRYNKRAAIGDVLDGMVLPVSDDVNEVLVIDEVATVKQWGVENLNAKMTLQIPSGATTGTQTIVRSDINPEGSQVDKAVMVIEVMSADV